MMKADDRPPKISSMPEDAVNRGTSVFDRPSRMILAAALLIVSACGKKKAASRDEKLAPLAASVDTPLVDKISREPGVSAIEASLPLAPAWVRETPRYYKRGGRRFASAVGWAKTADLALSRSTAEDRARVELLRFIKGVSSTGAVEGSLTGARMINSFKTDEGDVFVLVEIEAPASR